MARKDKHLEWEQVYIDKMTALDELFKERAAFLETFTLPGFEKVAEATDAGGSGETVDGLMTGGNTTEEKVWNFLVSKGLTVAAVCGIMGNLRQESGAGMPSDVVNSIGASGICQWLGSRKTGLKNFAKQQGKDWTDVQIQMEWMWKELNGADSTTKSILNKKGGLDKLINSSDMGWVVVTFEVSFERAGAHEKHYDKREKFGQEYYDKFAKGASMSSKAKSVAVEGGGSTTATGVYKKIVEEALAWQNRKNKYVFGGGRNSADQKAGRFDCSSWVSHVYKTCGKDIGMNTTTTLIAKGQKISASEAKPGDLVFWNTYKTNGHVGVYLGGSKAIGTQSSTGVAILDYANNDYWRKRYTGVFRRF